MLPALRHSLRHSLLLLLSLTLAPSSGLQPRSRRVSPPLDVDVLVYGATPAGVLAALGAAGEGASVALLDPRGWVGGMMTGGLAVTDIGVTTAVIGGRTRAFFEAVGRHYDNRTSGAQYNFEPHVAEAIFLWQLAQAPNVTVRLSSRIAALSGGAGAGGRHVTGATLADGSALTAAVLVDATYEGALLPLAGVSFTSGREAAAAWGESVAGVTPAPHPVWSPDHPLTTQPQPWVGVSGRDAAGAPLPGLAPAPGPVGSGDAMVQSYSFRATLTWDAANMVRPWPRPEGYNASLYGLQLQAIAARNLTRFAEVLSISQASPIVPGIAKVDWNNHYLSQFYLAGGYPAAVAANDWGAQQAIWDAHRAALLGLFYFLATDAAVPASIRDSAYEYGLAADEHAACGHWPCQLYVREALRLQGAYVFTQADVEGGAPQPDSVGRGAYTIDVMHGACFLARNASSGAEGVLCEGGFQAPSWLNKTLAPFQIPLRALLPKPEEAANLLVPVALSSSHVGFNAVRLEPTWMTLGESAGVAAAWAAARTGGDAHALNVYELQARLWELGQVL